MNRNGKGVAMWAGVVALLVLVCAGIPLKDLLFEKWYVHQLENGDEAGKEFAAQKLGKMRSEKAVPTLLLWMEDQNTPQRRRAAAATALQNIGLRAVPFILRKLEKVCEGKARLAWQDPGPRRAASNTMWTTPHFSSFCLSWPQKKGSFHRLWVLIPEHSDFLIAPLWDALRSAGEASVPPLVAGLKSEQWYVRHLAASLLEHMGARARDAVPTLAELSSRDQDAGVRRAAIVALKQIQASRTEIGFQGRSRPR